MGIVALIEGALAAMEHIIGVITKLRAIGVQTGELTAEQDAAYAKRQEDAFASPAWQPSKPKP